MRGWWRRGAFIPPVPPLGFRWGTRDAGPTGDRGRRPSRSPIAASSTVAGPPFRGRREGSGADVFETSLGGPGGVSSRAAAAELELQQPSPRGLIVRGSELPFSGGCGCQAGEIPAWTLIFQGFLATIAH